MFSDEILTKLLKSLDFSITGEDCGGIDRLAPPPTNRIEIFEGNSPGIQSTVTSSTRVSAPMYF